ncbi:hypothetical protein [Bradyrhizobium australafricanum]|uniref:hypothetical protein n=1 Tax=Bradyrhizobium australafricanum TaxID=2821406 RepID=UPI001CE2B6B5|nr:hypothetical protein [Bradyrhizobium australafricanum]MCA6104794.1 hypothetical protein [Bradyrhizobium australafricanum]
MAHRARRNSSPPLMPASLGGGPTVFKNCDARGSRQNLADMCGFSASWNNARQLTDFRHSAADEFDNFSLP